VTLADPFGATSTNSACERARHKRLMVSGLLSTGPALTTA
jgi:hypothetical protein